MVELVCPTCKVKFNAYPSAERKFCGRKCHIKTGSNNPKWRGGRTIDKDGYVLIYSPNHPDKNGIGYVREHRLVMEKHLGRRLTKDEIVHHKDENRQHNKIRNLEILDKKIHDALPGHFADGRKFRWNPKQSNIRGCSNPTMGRTK